MSFLWITLYHVCIPYILDIMLWSCITHEIITNFWMVCCKCFVFGRNKWISFSSFHSFICDVNQTWVKCTLFTLYNSCLNCTLIRAGKLKLVWLRNNMLSTEIFTPRNKENAYGQNYTRGQKNHLSLKPQHTNPQRRQDTERLKPAQTRADSSRSRWVKTGQHQTIPSHSTFPSSSSRGDVNDFHH